MNHTWRILRAETYRLWRGRVWMWGLVALVAVSALRVLAERAGAAATHAAAVQKALSAGRPAPQVPDVANAYGPFVDGWLAGLTVATLLLLIASSRSLAADANSGILRLATTRSSPRGALVTGRALLGIPLTVVAALISGLASWATAELLFEFGPIVEDGYELMSVAEIHGEIAAAAMSVLPALFAAWCFGLFISCCCRTGAAAVSAGLGVFLAFDLFKDVLGEARYWVFAAFTPSFVDSSAMAEAALAARGFSDAGFSAHVASLSTVVPLPQAALLIVAAIVVIRRRGL